MTQPNKKHILTGSYFTKKDYMTNTKVPRSFMGKRVLVVGGTGLIGSPLSKMLIEEEGADVRIVSKDDASRAHPKAEFKQLDLREPKNCLHACKNMEYVFSLFGVKGSPKMTAKRPATFFVPMITVNTLLMEAARLAGVVGYLYTSSVGAYPPAEVFKEENVWSGPPSPNDKFAGWAKRMGELQAEAYKIEYNWNDITIVYPCNVYGPLDNFDSENAMVVPSLIKRAVTASESGQPLIAWGDGSPIRDFIYAKDVAMGMMIAAKNGPGRNYNIGSGIGASIKELTDTIVKNLLRPVEVNWDTSAPSGDSKRLMDISRIRSIGFEPKTTLEEGIRDTISWYLENRDETSKRYDIFNTPK